MNDINPYKSIYINRKNLFEKCANLEPYNCTFNIYIIGEDMPINLLIRNAHDEPIHSYFPPNQMIIGVSEAFNILYFYTDIQSNQKGELFVNYKRGGNIIYSNISNDNFNSIEWNNLSNLYYDYNNRKVTFDLSNSSSNLNCDNGCRLYFGIYVSDYKIDDAGDFSFFLRFIESNEKTIVNIISNEYVYGNLTSDESDIYKIYIPRTSMILNIYFIEE